MPTLRTRKPTGLAPWPLIIVEGAEKTGKSYSATLLSADSRIGQMYWLDLGEGAADQYAELEGTDYLVLDHNGTYGSILEQVQAVCELPGVDKDGRPTALVIDSISNLWDLLKGEADKAARARRNVRADQEVTITMDLWNRATANWRKVLDELIRWDGLVILTARGKWTAVMDGSGKPVNGQKEYKLEGQKTLSYDADVILRILAPGQAELVGARSIHVGTERHGRSAPEYRSNGLAGVLFDMLKLGGQMGTRNLKVNEDTPEFTRALELAKALDISGPKVTAIIQTLFNTDVKMRDLDRSQQKGVVEALERKLAERGAPAAAEENPFAGDAPENGQAAA